MTQFAVGECVKIITDCAHDIRKYPVGKIYRIEKGPQYYIRFSDGHSDPFNESEIKKLTKLEKALL